jgi:hypothetical protein
MCSVVSSQTQVYAPCLNEYIFSVLSQAETAHQANLRLIELEENSLFVATINCSLCSNQRIIH